MKDNNIKKLEDLELQVKIIQRIEIPFLSWLIGCLFAIIITILKTM